MSTNSLVALVSTPRLDDSRIFPLTPIRIPAPGCGDESRPGTPAEEYAWRAVVERAVRALDRQRELARRQGLARYD
jgi:hypothetical protein